MPRRTESSSDPSISAVFLDEKLPGPFYGLPFVEPNLCHSTIHPPGRQRNKRPLHDRERKQFQLEQLSWKAMRNADLPIHSLPAELLLQIFEQFIRPAYLPDVPLSQRRPPDERPRRPWAILMRVCRHWCALIRSSASFWRDIVISKDTKWFDLALGRLGGAPFRIELAPGCSLKAVLPVLKRHADQIEKLVFEGEVRNTDVPHLRSFLSRSFPLLNNLALTLKSSRHIRSVKSSVCSSSPLRWLDLTRTSLPWTSSLFTHLEVLSLTDCRSSTPALSFSNFLDALENGKRLRYLHLERFLSAALDPQTSTPHERLITLPELQHLTCCDLPANVGQLMTHLYTPAISRVELLGECHDVGAPSTAHGSLLPEDASKRITVLRSITHASLNVTAQDNDLRCSRRSLEFEMSLVDPDSIEFWDEGPWVDRGLRQLPAMLGPALTELEVGGCLDVSQATWDRVFDAFPALQTLLIREYESVRFPTAMVHSLTAPPLLSASHYSGSTSAGRSRPVSPRVRCPNLKILRINGWDWSRRALAQILDCLRVRVAHGASKLEYLGIDAEGGGWVPELAPVLDKYRPRFLTVVREFDVFRYWW